MCTSIAKQLDAFYFGRNMDLPRGFGEEAVITPRGYPFRFRCGETLSRHYALIGMARVQAGYPLYADAANERGLCMAGLNFPQSARYDVEKVPGAANISPFEMIPWLLGKCATVAEALQLLARTHLTAIPFSADTPLATLHWHLADRERSVVLEPVAEGLRVEEDPAGVVTNEPPFPFHRENLRQYAHLSPDAPETAFPLPEALRPFGWGSGGLGLPGDLTSASRFVRAAFHAACSPAEGGVAQFFRLLDAVAVPRGSVREDGQYVSTRYSCCIDAAQGVYYYRAGDSTRVTALRLGDREGDALLRFPLRTAADVLVEN